MWTCPNCNRIFGKTGQSHSCHKIPLSRHFEHKEIAQALFDYLVAQIKREIGECSIISIPCCIHLFGKYDFLAALPKKDKLEIRFTLDRKVSDQRLIACVPVAAGKFKNCFTISQKEQIDDTFIGWIRESYGTTQLG